MWTPCNHAVYSNQLMLHFPCFDSIISFSQLNAGIYFACLTLAKYTAGNQQLIPVESDLICISVHLDEDNTVSAL